DASALAQPRPSTSRLPCRDSRRPPARSVPPEPARGGWPAPPVEQIELIRSTEVDGIQLLAGSEVNILPDGSLDYDDELLAQLDWVLASVHTSFRMTPEAMTARIVRAIEHPLVDVIGHPSGRKIEQRPPHEYDLEKV